MLKPLPFGKPIADMCADPKSFGPFAGLNAGSNSAVPVPGHACHACGKKNAAMGNPDDFYEQLQAGKLAGTGRSLWFPIFSHGKVKTGARLDCANVTAIPPVWVRYRSSIAANALADSVSSGTSAAGERVTATCRAPWVTAAARAP